ncbi:hypothetical protein K2X83_02520, partial [Patescibacteria group bacterium]|nr:hypothetical protein [Patescibacteria group bacterium]
AYPDSQVTLLRDSVLISRQPIEESAAFAIRVDNLAAGTYLFNLYATDKSGYQSASTPVPVTLGPGVTVTVTGIYLAPTIDVDKEEVRQGNPIRVFGHTSPTSTVSIMVNSENELFFETASDEDGVYAYSFVTSPLELGQHSTRSIASKSGQVSKTSGSVAFKVGLQDILKTKKTTACGSLRGDLNCDGKVNLVDFSIQAFWYKKRGFPVAYDLNNDKQITLIDFSIMASNWTG